MDIEQTGNVDPVVDDSTETVQAAPPDDTLLADEADREEPVHAIPSSVRRNRSRSLTRRRTMALDDVPTQIRDRTGPLANEFRNSSTTGAGVRVLQRLDDRRHGDAESEDHRVAFIAERVAIPVGTNKNKRKQMAGKNLKYENCDAVTRKGLDNSRVKEWKKWMDFSAGVVLEKETLDELVAEGHSQLPTQWIETDQNDYLRRPGKPHTPDYKSRLVACGQLENCEGIRADSPTCDVEGLNLLCSWAACSKLRLDTADIRNAYFNADPMDRLL